MNQSPRANCGTYQVPPVLPELQAAIDQVAATGQPFAFTVYRSWDGLAWRVQIKRINVYLSLAGEFSSQDEASSAGGAWLNKITTDSVFN